MATPLTATRLLTALRAEGCAVREYRSWRTHERDDETGKPFGPVHGVMCHHTGPYTTEAGMIALVYDGRSGLPGPLSHGVIDNAGTVWLTSAGRANHAGGGDPRVLDAVIGEDYGDYPPETTKHEGSPGAADGNDVFYGFECINAGDGKDPWPRAQYVAMVKAHAAICRAYSWGSKSVIGHKEWSDHKIDPRGIDMRIFRRDVAACLAHAAGRWPDVPAPAPEEDDVPSIITRTDPDDATITPGAWTLLNVDGVDLLLGAAVYDMTVYVEGAGVPGGTLQGRFHHVRTDGTRWYGPLVERPVTAGNTYADFGHAGKPAAGEKVRFELAYYPPPASTPDTEPFAVSNTRVRGLLWEV